MNNQEVINYVMHTPGNTNPTILKQMLEDTSVQSDWNQNDSTQPDYVKNRPLYTGDAVESDPLDLTGAIWALQDVLYMTQYMGEGNFPLTVGGTATLTVDGKKYTGIVEDYSSFIGAGVVGFGDIDGFVNNDVSAINFLVYGGSADGQFGVYVAVKADAEPTSCTIGSIVQEVKQIDSKYLPGQILPSTATDGEMVKFNGISWETVPDPTEFKLIYGKTPTAGKTEIACKIDKVYKKILVVVGGVKVNGTTAKDIYVGTSTNPVGNYKTSGFCKIPLAAQPKDGEVTNSFLLIEKLPSQGHLCFANKTPYGNGYEAYDSDILMTYNRKSSLVIPNQIDSTTLYFGIDGDTFTGAGSLSLYGILK